MENKRRIIYVDAGTINSNNFKISLYDPQSNATHVMELSEVININEAEKYAVYYAALYVNKKGFENCMILCDNKAAAEDKIISALLKELHIHLSWIPREINKIADKTVKRDATLDECELNTLKLFVKLTKKAYNDLVSNPKNDLKKQEELLQKLKEKNQKIKNQVTQINALKKKCEKK